MQRRFMVALFVFLLTMPALPVAASNWVCFSECNVGGENYCIYTGNCYKKCLEIAGGCVSTYGADCFDSCHM